MVWFLLLLCSPVYKGRLFTGLDPRQSGISMKVSTLNCHIFGTGLEDFEESVISATFGAKIQIYDLTVKFSGPFVTFVVHFYSLVT